MTVVTLYSECIYECMKSCRTSFPTVYRLFTLDNIKKICQSAATNKSSEIALSLKFTTATESDWANKEKA